MDPNFFLSHSQKSFATEGPQPQANNISFFLCPCVTSFILIILNSSVSLFNAHFSLSIGSKLGLKRDLERDLHHFQGLFILLALILWDISRICRYTLWQNSIFGPKIPKLLPMSTNSSKCQQTAENVNNQMKM